MSKFFSLAYLTLPNTHPVDQIEIAAQCGYEGVGLRTISQHLPGEPDYALANGRMFQMVRAALERTGVRLMDIELARVADGVDVMSYEKEFALGAELGANEEIISSLGTIGLNALAVTLTSMVGSMLSVHALRKYLLKLNAQGRSCQEAPEDSDPGSGEAVHVDHSLTFAIVFTVAAGILAGRFLLPDAAVAHCGTVIRWGLYLLLFLVGLDMGRQGSLIRDIRAAGLRVLLVPLAVMAGTFAVTALVGLFLPLGPKDCVAAAAGFGWYSLAPTLLAPYSLTVSATAFLSNIMHELFSIVAVPIVAQKLGYIEAVALPGATAMDTLLPVVVSATADRMAIYSFASGLILSLAVPVLVPAIIALPL